MSAFDRNLPPLRLDKSLFESLTEESKKTGLSMSELRRLCIQEYFKKDRQYLHIGDIKTKGEKRKLSVRISDEIMNELESSQYMKYYDSINSLITHLFVYLLSGNILFNDENIRNIFLLKREIQSLGRNLNQSIRAINYQIKVKDQADKSLYVDLDISINDLKKINSSILKILSDITG